MKILTKINRLFILLAIFFGACSSADQTAEELVIVPVSEVKITNIENSPIVEYITINATSSYLQKSYIKANMNGYVAFSEAQLGKQVSKNTTLFKLITKEAKAIGNEVNKLDPSFRFSGVSSIKADALGFISEVNHQKGDYVQDGEPLATISNQNSLVFLLDMPYEFNQLLKRNQQIELTLPDGETLKGIFSGTLPNVDSMSQTQRIILKVNPSHPIPEGLIAKAKFIKTNHPKALLLPKSAVLTNETEDEFWVMKLLNDSTAVKVVITKGIENEKNIEILTPKFNTNERIITSGNYGIADTAKVKIIK